MPNRLSLRNGKANKMILAPGRKMKGGMRKVPGDGNAVLASHGDDGTTVVREDRLKDEINDQKICATSECARRHRSSEMKEHTPYHV